MANSPDEKSIYEIIIDLYNIAHSLIDSIEELRAMVKPKTVECPSCYGSGVFFPTGLPCRLCDGEGEVTPEVAERYIRS